MEREYITHKALKYMYNLTVIVRNQSALTMYFTTHLKMFCFVSLRVAGEFAQRSFRGTQLRLRHLSSLKDDKRESVCA